MQSRCFGNSLFAQREWILLPSSFTRNAQEEFREDRLA